MFLLAIWLIEYDPDFQRTAATRLPVPVISSHAMLAICGLIVWVSYLVTGQDQFAYATLAILALVVCLGIVMAVRWVKVYRSTEAPTRRSVKAMTVPATATVVASGGSGGSGALFNGNGGPRRASAAQAGAAPPGTDLLVPPERHFPLSVVIGHGLFAITTVILVLLSVLGIGEH